MDIPQGLRMEIGRILEAGRGLSSETCISCRANEVSRHRGENITRELSEALVRADISPHAFVRAAKRWKEVSGGKWAPPFLAPRTNHICFHCEAGETGGFVVEDLWHTIEFLP